MPPRSTSEIATRDRPAAGSPTRSHSTDPTPLAGETLALLPLRPKPLKAPNSAPLISRFKEFHNPLTYVHLEATAARQRRVAGWVRNLPTMRYARVFTWCLTHSMDSSH